jgi:hypothetical protein
MSDKFYYMISLLIFCLITYFIFVYFFNLRAGLKGVERFELSHFEKNHPKLEKFARWVGVVLYIPIGLYFFG